MYKTIPHAIVLLLGSLALPQAMAAPDGKPHKQRRYCGDKADSQILGTGTGN